MVEPANERPPSAEEPSARRESGAEMLDIARSVDPDHGLTLLFAPADRRAELSGLVILNNELARIPFQVSETMLGLVRLQWWRDAITAAAVGAAGDSPALRAIGPALRQQRLAVGDLVALIDAREDELEHRAPSDLEVLDARMAATSGALTRLMASCLGVTGPPLAAASLVGRAHGLVRTILAAAASPGHLAELLPERLLSDAGLIQRDPLATESRLALTQALEPILARADQHLLAARRMMPRPARHHMAPFLLAVVTRHHLRAVRRGSGDLGRIGSMPRSGGLVLAMLLAHALRLP